jgi:Transglycosylase SLT domain
MIANPHTTPNRQPHVVAKEWGQTALRSAMGVTRNGIALVGLAMASLTIVLLAHDGWRDAAEHRVLTLLLERQEARPDGALLLGEPQAIDRVTAAQPSDLPKPQAKVAFWLSRKYRVAPEPLSVLVAEAFSLGEKIKLDPTLILAVMAIESRFNPFSQSPYGAQGLMQVLTRVHTDKYEDFGGSLAAFDPVSNLRVGVQVLQDCIKRAGSTEGGLRLYVGAVSVDGGDYVTKVMAEHIRLRDVALGKTVSVQGTKAPAARAPNEQAPTGTDPLVESDAAQAPLLQETAS